MTTETQEPSRLPVRGTVATVGTVGALTLLLSFQGGPLAPSDPVTAADDETPATDELSGPDAADPAGDGIVEPVTYTGDVFRTRWGDVQLEVTLEGSDITEIVALQMPWADGHTIALSEEVAPILREEAIAADSASGLSVVSGATYTSEAYADSLQSALDQASLAPADVSEPSLPDPTPAVTAEDPVEATEPDFAAEEPAEEVTDETVVARGRRERGRGGRSHRHGHAVSANVSVISGATDTSEADATSLQSALDQLRT